MAKKTKWIQTIDLNKGSFGEKAKRHGMTVNQFIDYVIKHKDRFPTTTLRQAYLAKTFKRIRKGK